MDKLFGVAIFGQYDMRSGGTTESTSLEDIRKDRREIGANLVSVVYALQKLPYKEVSHLIEIVANWQERNGEELQTVIKLMDQGKQKEYVFYV